MGEPAPPAGKETQVGGWSFCFYCFGDAVLQGNSGAASREVPATPQRAPKRGPLGGGGEAVLTFIFYFRQVAGSPFVWLRSHRLPSSAHCFICLLRMRVGECVNNFHLRDLLHVSSSGKKLIFQATQL